MLDCLIELSHLLRMALSFLGSDIALLQVGDGDLLAVGRSLLLPPVSFCSTDVGSIDLGLDIG